jgi:hypothetical protein
MAGDGREWEYSREELLLLHEAIAYISRRLFDPHDARRLREVGDQVESALLGGGERAAVRLVLDEASSRVLAVALAAYAEELSQPGGHPSNRTRARELQRLAEQLRVGRSLLGRLRGLWRRLRGARGN